MRLSWSKRQNLPLPLLANSRWKSLRSSLTRSTYPSRFTLKKKKSTKWKVVDNQWKFTDVYSWPSTTSPRSKWTQDWWEIENDPQTIWEQKQLFWCVDHDNNFNPDLNQVREEARLPAVSSAVLYEIFPFIMVTIIILIIILIIIILVIIMVTIINSTSSSPFSSARCHYHDLLQISASQTCTSSQVFGEDMVIQSIGRSLTQILPNLPGQVPATSWCNVIFPHSNSSDNVSQLSENERVLRHRETPCWVPVQQHSFQVTHVFAFQGQLFEST